MFVFVGLAESHSLFLCLMHVFEQAIDHASSFGPQVHKHLIEFLLLLLCLGSRELNQLYLCRTVVDNLSVIFHVKQGEAMV